MIAADRPWFDQPHVEVGPLRRERERREPAGEPAADDRDVAFIDPLPRHPFALATPARHAKPLQRGGERLALGDDWLGDPFFRACDDRDRWRALSRSEEHTSELQSLMRI